MKYSGTLLLSALFVLAALACKQETASKADSNAPPATAKENKVQTKPPSTIADLPEMKTSLQGKWKSATEPGVVYHIQGDQLERIVNGTLEKTMQLSFSTSCAMGCGNIDKRYGRSGSAGCLTLSGAENTCFWVISYAKDQLDFIRMGKPGAKPESWIKM